MPSSPAASFLTSLTLTAIFYLILTVSLITVIFSLLVITSTSKHKVLPCMGSYHSRQIADLVLLISEFNFFSTFNTNGIFVLSRYIDDGFMLTNNANRNQITTDLISSYPTQIPITFTSNHHSVNYLDLTISLNHHTIMYHKIHYQIYQKPHHKYMYPHFSPNHPQNVFASIIKTETSHDTADSPRLLTITTLYANYLHSDLLPWTTQPN